MFVRYQKGPDGKAVKKALVYTQKEHGIRPEKVSPDARQIVEKLHNHGHQAYIVGGAVRDLLLGRQPKDYDIVTDAQPYRIKKLFYRSRVIGRRFRLVHVYVGNTIYEVSTFRSIANGTIGNTYGSIDEDALRRDFSINALYYDPHESLLVDYVNGFKDIKSRRISAVIPLKTIFTEDPVRMLRAIKYKEITGFRLPLGVSLAIKRQSALLKESSVSRLCEEAIKILASGYALKIIRGLHAYSLLDAIFPSIVTVLNQPEGQILMANIGRLDRHIVDGGNKNLRFLLEFLLESRILPLCEAAPHDSQKFFKTVHDEAKVFMAPLAMPRVELEAAVLAIIQRKWPQFRRPRRNPPKPAQNAKSAQNAKAEEKAKGQEQKSAGPKRKKRAKQQGQASGKRSSP